MRYGTADHIWRKRLRTAAIVTRPATCCSQPRAEGSTAGAIVDGWKAYNITSDNESGIGAWSDEEIERYLSSGHAQARGSAGGGMAEAIDLSLRHLIL